MAEFPKCPWCGEDNTGPYILCLKCEALAKAKKGGRP